MVVRWTLASPKGRIGSWHCTIDGSRTICGKRIGRNAEQKPLADAQEITCGLCREWAVHGIDARCPSCGSRNVRHRNKNQTHPFVCYNCRAWFDIRGGYVYGRTIETSPHPVSPVPIAWRLTRTQGTITRTRPSTVRQHLTTNGHTTLCGQPIPPSGITPDGWLVEDVPDAPPCRACQRATHKG